MNTCLAAFFLIHWFVGVDTSIAGLSDGEASCIPSVLCVFVSVVDLVKLQVIYCKSHNGGS